MISFLSVVVGTVRIEICIYTQLLSGYRCFCLLLISSVCHHIMYNFTVLHPRCNPQQHITYKH